GRELPAVGEVAPGGEGRPPPVAAVAGRTDVTDPHVPRVRRRGGSSVDRRATRDQGDPAGDPGVARRAAAPPACRPPGAVEEHPPRVPLVRALPPTEPRLAGASPFPRAPHAVARGARR